VNPYKSSQKSCHQSTTSQKKVEVTYAVDAEVLAVKPLSSGTSNESNSGSNVLGKTETSIRVLFGDEINDMLGLARTEKGCVDGSRGNSVDGNTSTTKIFSEDTSNLFDCTLGGDVAQSVR
jgi:hypothetical protein